MPTERLAMRDVIRLKSAGMPIREIAVAPLAAWDVEGREGPSAVVYCSWQFQSRCVY
jgi:hypothetical protein